MSWYGNPELAVRKGVTRNPVPGRVDLWLCGGKEGWCTAAARKSNPSAMGLAEVGSEPRRAHDERPSKDGEFKHEM